MLVRARESEPSIIREVSRRKLVRALTPAQEKTLKTQGAGESLLRALRRSDITLAAADATAFEARWEQKRSVPPVSVRATSSMDAGQDGLQFSRSPSVIRSTSASGTVLTMFAFHPPTRLDEGREDAVLIDNIRTGTHVATYLGAGRPDDSTTIFDRRNYVSAMEHSFTRGLRIDRKNPVQMKGSPYTFYPVYAAGGVSLYYIGGSTDSVKLAVSTSGK